MLEKGGQAFVLYAAEARGDSKERALVLGGVPAASLSL